MTEQFDVKQMLLQAVRYRRNQLLTASDWTVLPDSPKNKTSWEAYRQQLRDITNDPRIDTLNHWDDQVALDFFPEQPTD
jgi:predicted NAD/FAD-binding protein